MKGWAYPLHRSNLNRASIISQKASFRELLPKKKDKGVKENLEVSRFLWRDPHANQGLWFWIGMSVLSNRTPTQQNVQLLPQSTGIVNWEDLLFQSSAWILTQARSDDTPPSPGAQPACCRCPSQCWKMRNMRKGADEAILLNELQSRIFSTDFSAISSQLATARALMLV